MPLLGLHYLFKKTNRYQLYFLFSSLVHSEDQLIGNSNILHAAKSQKCSKCLLWLHFHRGFVISTCGAKTDKRTCFLMFQWNLSLINSLVNKMLITWPRVKLYNLFVTFGKVGTKHWVIFMFYNCILLYTVSQYLLSQQPPLEGTKGGVMNEYINKQLQ